jgi:hypothetical protein
MRVRAFFMCGKGIGPQFSRIQERTMMVSNKGAVQRVASTQARRLVAVAVGATALGALALGAVAIGALTIGRARVKQATIAKLEIDELTVRRLRFEEIERLPLGQS